MGLGCAPPMFDTNILSPLLRTLSGASKPFIVCAHAGASEMKARHVNSREHFVLFILARFFNHGFKNQKNQLQCPKISRKSGTRKNKKIILPGYNSDPYSTT